jgi:Tol biopolymer transport system component
MASGFLRHGRGATLALAACVLALTSVGGAGAAPRTATAFPGKNGRIAFNAGGAIYVVKPDGTGLARLAETSSDDNTGGVSWSADGRWLAFSAFRGSDPDVYAIRSDGTGLRQVTFSRGIDVDPTWSRDGDRIAFETNRNGQVDIYSVDARGRDPKRLTTARQDELDPAWSPKGDRIAYTVQVSETSRQVWVMNADGSGKTQLTNAPNFNENPTWSPDGSRIAFDSDREERGNLEVYSMKADGTGVVRLTNHPALDALPAWSPDGTSIVFVSDRLQKDSRRLFLMPASGGSAKRLLAREEPASQMVPDWQPLRSGRVEPPPSPPGRTLPGNGVADRVDGLYDVADAWSVRMRAGVTYRINLSPRRACASIRVFPPRTRAFATGTAVAFRQCGGYFTYTPGPKRGGVYSLLVSAPAGSETIVNYHLQAAAAGVDDVGPGIHLAGHGERASGSLFASGIDVEDLYSFDVARRSAVRVDLRSTARLGLQLTTVEGEPVAEARAGALLRKTLVPGSYVLAVVAPPRVGGRYELSTLVRAVTKTTLTADRRRKLSVPVGTAVELATSTSPSPGGGRVMLRLDYLDPRSGWVFRQSWTAVPGGTLSFVPPHIGTWRVRASFFGTLTSSPSRSDGVTIEAVAPG